MSAVRSSERSVTSAVVSNFLTPLRQLRRCWHGIRKRLKTAIVIRSWELGREARGGGYVIKGVFNRATPAPRASLGPKQRVRDYGCV